MNHLLAEIPLHEWYSSLPLRKRILGNFMSSLDLLSSIFRVLAILSFAFVMFRINYSFFVFFAFSLLLIFALNQYYTRRFGDKKILPFDFIIPICKKEFILEFIDWRRISVFLETRTTVTDLLELSIHREIEKRNLFFQVIFALLVIVLFSFFTYNFWGELSDLFFYFVYCAAFLTILGAAIYLVNQFPHDAIMKMMEANRKAILFELVGYRREKRIVESGTRSIISASVFILITIILAIVIGIVLFFEVKYQIVIFLFVLYYVKWVKNYYQYLVYYNERIILGQIDDLEILFDLYSRKNILKDDDWYRGQEELIKSLCVEYKLSPHYYEKIINPKA
ncbi:MAG: hypothetical protein ACFCU1_10365 [Sumerlaeia bacterium]